MTLALFVEVPILDLSGLVVWAKVELMEVVEVSGPEREHGACL